MTHNMSESKISETVILNLDEKTKEKEDFENVNTFKSPNKEEKTSKEVETNVRTPYK